MEWKNGCAEMQVGFKILLYLLERLIKRGYKNLSQKEWKAGWERLAKKTIARREDFFYRDKDTFGQVHNELLLVLKPS